MNTQELLKDLQAKYPNLTFGLDKKDDLALHESFPEEELKDVPEYLINFDSGGIGIWDPYCSECSRFKVDPKKEYGINEEDAKRIVEHNKLNMH